MSVFFTRCVWRPIVLSLLTSAAAVSLGQLRVATYNLTNYSSGRDSQFKSIFYGVYNGRQFAPDIVIGQEFLSASAVTNFLNILNAAPGSPKDWKAAPFIDGPDTDGAFFYRSSKVSYLATTTVAFGSSDQTNQPRNTYRYDVRPVGYTADSTVMALYNSHMKAGATDTDMQRRLVEAQRIRANANTLNPNWQIIFGGDLNIQSSSQAAYQELVGSTSNNRGRFWDPIQRPGTWNNSSTFRMIHTQDPASQMDDRLDQLLIGGSLFDNKALDYICVIDPNTSLPKPWDLNTWNDPNHTYRTWGNDGTSFNAPLNTTSNQMVGNVIAQALVDSSNGNGHVPTYMDLRVPAKVTSATTINFGSVPLGSFQERPLSVRNSGDVSLWTVGGVATLNYSLGASTGFSAPFGPFSAAPGTSGNTHMIRLDTSRTGFVSGTVTIMSDDPDQPLRAVQLRAAVYSKLPVPIPYQR